jgi:hypothetical protein
MLQNTEIQQIVLSTTYNWNIYYIDNVNIFKTTNYKWKPDYEKEWVFVV